MTKSISITLIRMIDVMKNGVSRPLLITGLIAMFLMGACDPDAGPNEAQLDLEDSESVQADAEEDFYFDDSDDLSGEALDAEFSTSGKIKTDERLACATITRTGDDTNGSVTVSFGDGCTDQRGRVRRGSLLIEFEGRRGTLGAWWRLTFVDYFINGVRLEGTRTVTNTIVGTNSSEFEVRLDDGTATFPDGRIAKRKVHRRRIHERDENNLLDRLIIYGTEEGNHRNGRGFYIEILEPLVYDRECYKNEGVIIPVSGKKLIKHGEREITVDYGDGTCDNLVTITNKNGRTWEYTVD